MLKTSIDTQLASRSAMFFPLQKLGIVCCTSLDEGPSQQYGWLRLSKNRRKFIRHFTTILTIFLQTSICRSQDLCSVCRSKGARGLQPGLVFVTSATECTAASGPLLNTGTERHAYRSRVERSRELAEPHYVAEWTF